MYKRSTVFLALALGMLAVLPTASLAADAPHAGATAGGSAAAGGQGKQAAGGKIIVTGRSHVADSSGVGNANSRAYGQAHGKYSKAKTGAKTVATVGAHLGKNGN